MERRFTMLAEKQRLTLADLDAQTALVLPERETPATVVVSCVAVCIGQIRISNIDVAVAATVCANVAAIVNALSAGVVNGIVLDCQIRGGRINQ
jgi:hypothetical protein